jgi:hypothetical protein
MNMAKLTKKEYQEMCQCIIEHGKGRKEQTDNFKEVDFLCGAMACMDYFGISLPVWPIMIMAGRKVILTDLERVGGSAKDLLVKRLKHAY